MSTAKRSRDALKNLYAEVARELRLLGVQVDDDLKSEDGAAYGRMLLEYRYLGNVVWVRNPFRRSADTVYLHQSGTDSFNYAGIAASMKPLIERQQDYERSNPQITHNRKLMDELLERVGLIEWTGVTLAPIASEEKPFIVNVEIDAATLANVQEAEELIRTLAKFKLCRLKPA